MKYKFVFLQETNMNENANNNTKNTFSYGMTQLYMNQFMLLLLVPYRAQCHVCGT
jgi:hypothetical protein